MNAVLEYNELRKDILGLYCKTKISSLEEVFIKVAQSSITGWLHKNRKMLSKKLSNSEVLDALDALIFLQSKVGDSPSMHSIITAINPQPRYMASIPVIIAIKRVMDDSLYILDPFAPIINLISKMTPNQELPDERVIREDLEKIQGYFSEQKGGASGKSDDAGRYMKGTLIQQRQRMFYNLLNRFSSDMASAASSQGMPELASLFNSGILANSISLGIGRHVELDLPSVEQAGIAYKLSNYVYEYPSPENESFFYNLINIELAKRSGVITEEDAFRFKELIDENRNVTGMDEGQEDLDIPIPQDDRLNPDFIVMLVAFFQYLQKKVKIQPSAFF